MKKTFSVLLAVLMIAACALTAFAAGISISVSDKIVCPGDTVEIPVVVKNNPGFASVQMYATYNKNVLVLEEIRLGVASNCIANAASGVIAGGSASDIKGDGTLFTLVFKVSDSAKTGDYAVNIRIAELYNAADDCLINEGTIVSGTISVKEEYVISYNANGGTGAPESQRVRADQDAVISSYIPVKEGYNFKGWATEANGAVKYSAGAKYTARETITLYAVWEAKVYDVSFDANGGTDEPAAQKKTHDSEMVISSVTPVREGHDFLGWAESPSATKPDYTAGGKYNTEGDNTLYAVWKVHTYEVIFNAGKGEDAPASQQKTWGEDLEITSAVPVREGYTFLGWTANAESKDKSVDFVPGAVYTENTPIELFAVWTVDKNVPEGKTAISLDSVKAKEGKTIEIPVVISDNPGFASVQLKIEYDETVMTLEGIDIGMATNCLASAETGIVAGASSSDITGDGVLFTLVFSINEDAEIGIYDIEMKVIEFYTANDENIDPYVVNSEANIIDFIPGDANGDDVVSSRDATAILRYLVGEVDDKTVDVDAADYNGDGTVSSRDATAILRYLIGQ